jgi:hypothetical protein
MLLLLLPLGVQAVQTGLTAAAQRQTAVLELANKAAQGSCRLHQHQLQLWLQ